MEAVTCTLGLQSQAVLGIKAWQVMDGDRTVSFHKVAIEA